MRSWTLYPNLYMIFGVLLAMADDPNNILLTLSNSTRMALYEASFLNLTVCPENVYSEDQKAYRVYANLPISLFGILSNVLNIIVFVDSEMRTMLVNHFLLALSISDLILLICNFFFLVLPVVVVETDSFFWNDIFPVIIRYMYPLALTTQTAGVYLTVLVSVHRFLGVCYPFKAKRWVTRKPVTYAIFGSIVLSVLVNVPTFFELYVVPCYSERFHAPSQQIALAEFHQLNYIIIKKTIVYTLIMFVIPFGTLIFVNWRMVLAMRESSNLRSKMNSTKSSEQTVVNQSSEAMVKNFRVKSRPYAEFFQTLSKISNSNLLKPSTEMFKTKFTNGLKDRSVTLMLLAIVALFLSLNSLAFCNSIIESIILIRSIEDDEFVNFFENLVELSNILITVNSSTSIFVYLAFSSKFRLVFGSTLLGKKRLNRIALSTGYAANRLAEFSLLPDEVERRHKKDKKNFASPFNKRRGTDAMSYCSNNSSILDATHRKKMFRAAHYSHQSLTTQSLTNSDSNLRLMDDQDTCLHDKRLSKASLPSDNLSTC